MHREPEIPPFDLCREFLLNSDWGIMLQADTSDKTQPQGICHFFREDVAKDSAGRIPQGSSLCSLVEEIFLWSKFQELLSCF